MMSSNNSTLTSEKPEFIIKPKVSFGISAIRYSVFIIIPILFIIFFLLTSNESEKQLLPIMGFICLVWFILWVGFTTMGYFLLKSTEYHFYNDRIERRHCIKAFDQYNITIYNKNIRQIKIIKNIYNKIFGLGNIYIKLYTPIKTSRSKLKSKIIIDSIENSDIIYNELKHKIE